MDAGAVASDDAFVATKGFVGAGAVASNGACALFGGEDDGTYDGTYDGGFVRAVPADEGGTVVVAGAAAILGAGAGVEAADSRGRLK